MNTKGRLAGIGRFARRVLLSAVVAAAVIWAYLPGAGTAILGLVLGTGWGGVGWMVLFLAVSAALLWLAGRVASSLLSLVVAVVRYVFRVDEQIAAMARIESQMAALDRIEDRILQLDEHVTIKHDE